MSLRQVWQKLRYKCAHKSHEIWLGGGELNKWIELSDINLYNFKSAYVKSYILKKEHSDWINETFQGPWHYDQPRIYTNLDLVSGNSKLAFKIYIALDEDYMMFLLKYRNMLFK